MLVDGQAVTLSGEQFSLSTSVEVEEGQVATVLSSGAVVVLDTEITAELETEGYARDLVRAIQDERKTQDLHVSDRIELTLYLPEERLLATKNYADMISHEVLATQLQIEQSPGKEVKIEITAVHPIEN